MNTFKFNIIPEDIDNHIRQSLTEEGKEYFKDVKFMPCHVHYNENMEIEITAVPVLKEPEEVLEEEQE